MLWFLLANRIPEEQEVNIMFKDRYGALKDVYKGKMCNLPNILVYAIACEDVVEVECENNTLAIYFAG